MKLSSKLGTIIKQFRSLSKEDQAKVIHKSKQYRKKQKE